MVKKMKKYAKFVVCMGLILGLMAPSYAALSASDGSAFVTKAEFDSALADFNARLTTFEAGINSKIDSQVTSYLDRNGIWSGKDQDCKGFQWRLGEAVEHTEYMQTATTTTLDWQIADGFIGAVPLCKISKSGLMILKVIDTGDGLTATMDYRRNKICNNTGGNISNNTPVFVNVWLYAYRFVEIPAPNGSGYSYGGLQTSLGESTSRTKGFKQNDGTFVSTDNIKQEYVNIIPYNAYIGIRGTGSDNYGYVNPCIPTSGGCNFTTQFFVEANTYLGFACHSYWQIQTNSRQSAYRMYVDSAQLTTIVNAAVY